jgi:hypothetical protein
MASMKSNALEAETVATDNNVVEADEVAIEGVGDTEVITVEDEAAVDHVEELVEIVEDHDAVRSPRSQISNVQFVWTIMFRFSMAWIRKWETPLLKHARKPNLNVQIV